LYKGKRITARNQGYFVEVKDISIVAGLRA
jgi:hypothetical protein